MSDERSGSEDPGPISDVEVPVDEDVIDISDGSGPELTTNVDDSAPSAGSSAPRSDAEAVRGEDTGSSGGQRNAGVEPPD
jgi:hypothetical protein